MMPLKAGFASCDITPPLGAPMAGYGNRDHGATALEDPLEARVLVLDNGETTVGFVCTDLIGVQARTVAGTRERIEADTDIPPKNVMICGSHTHFGPALEPVGYMTEKLKKAVSEDYRVTLMDSLAGLVSEAYEHMQPVRVGCGTGRALGISFNRRPVNIETKEVAMNLTMEPEAAVAASMEGAKLADMWPRMGHLGPRLTSPLSDLDGLSAGIVDNEVPILRVDTADGEPLATLVSFACHAVVNSDDHYAISPDYIVTTREAFEGVIGGHMLFAAGCAGDQVPTWRRGNSRRRVGHALGAEAAATWEKIETLSDDVSLGCSSRTVNLPIPDDYPTPEEVEEDLAAVEDKDSYEYRRQQTRLERAQEHADDDSIEREVWAARVGDMGIACTPSETLVEIGMQIKQRSPFDHTSVFSITNDYCGYLCTDEAFTEGGYEPGIGYNLNGPGTEEILVETLLEMLQELA
ncbi:MAG: neutral/alkaline non-lysosomal ceramidase N-terminal domain-containing protein [Armatimonadota bacterium]